MAKKAKGAQTEPQAGTNGVLPKLKAVYEFMTQSGYKGLYNLGSGKARTWKALVQAIFSALGKPPRIEYIDMPENIRGHYQYFTEAKVDNLLRAGYNAGFTSLEDGVKRYVTQFLDTADCYR